MTLAGFHSCYVIKQSAFSNTEFPTIQDPFKNSKRGGHNLESYLVIALFRNVTPAASEFAG